MYLNKRLPIRKYHKIKIQYFKKNTVNFTVLMYLPCNYQDFLRMTIGRSGSVHSQYKPELIINKNY